MSIQIVNPFRVDSEVEGSNFCGRDNDKDSIEKLINSKTNIIMFAKRRIGKSSLIKEVFANKLNKATLKINVNINSITSVKELYEHLNEGIQDALSKHKNSTEKLVSAIKEFQKHFNNTSISIEFSGTPKLIIKTTDRDYYNALRDTLRGLISYIESKNIKAVFAIDEFQKIVELEEYKKIEETLRTLVVKRGDNISFVFTGSKRRLLHSMFSDPNRPFYKLGIEYPLKPIKQETYLEWANNKLKPKEIIIEREAFEYIYKECDGETRFIQKSLNFIYDNTKETSLYNLENAKELVDYLVSISQMADLFNRHTVTKQKALKLLANNRSDYYKQDTLENYDISKSSLQSAIKGLIQSDDIYEEKNREYVFEDVELRMYLRR